MLRLGQLSRNCHFSIQRLVVIFNLSKFSTKLKFSPAADYCWSSIWPSFKFTFDRLVILCFCNKNYCAFFVLRKTAVTSLFEAPLTATRAKDVAIRRSLIFKLERCLMGSVLLIWAHLHYLIPRVTVRTLTKCFPTNIFLKSFILPFCLFLTICKEPKCVGDKNINLSLIPDKRLGLLQYLHDVSSKCKVTIVWALAKAHYMCSYFQPTPWSLPYPWVEMLGLDQLNPSQPLVDNMWGCCILDVKRCVVTLSSSMQM